MYMHVDDRVSMSGACAALAAISVVGTPLGRGIYGPEQKIRISGFGLKK